MIIKFVWFCPYTHDKYFRIFEHLSESKQLYKITPTAFMTFECLAERTMYHNKENSEYFYYHFRPLSPESLSNESIKEINSLLEVSDSFMRFIEEVK
jgi:hypothetical protein